MTEEQPVSKPRTPQTEAGRRHVNAVVGLGGGQMADTLDVEPER